MGGPGSKAEGSQEVQDPAWLCFLSWNCCWMRVVELRQGTAENPALLRVVQKGVKMTRLAAKGFALVFKSARFASRGFETSVSLSLSRNSRNDKNVL